MTQLEELQAEERMGCGCKPSDKPKGPAACLYDKSAPRRWVCVEENNDVFNLDGSRVNLHIHCAWVPCSCPHHIQEANRDHTSCKCPKAPRASSPPAPVKRVLRRPTPKPSIPADAGAEDSGQADHGGTGPVVDRVRRGPVRPQKR